MGLATVPWSSHAAAAFPIAHRIVFPTGSASVDKAMNGGMLANTLMVVLRKPGDISSTFLQQMAQTNRVLQVQSKVKGNADMLSLMIRAEGHVSGCLLMDGPEPATEKELMAMQHDRSAREAFLTRWFQRARAVVHETGGIMAICVASEFDNSTSWRAIPDYVVSEDGLLLKLATASAKS